MAGHGGDTKSKNAIIQRWLRKDTGKVATLTEHINDLLAVYHRSDPTNIRNSIRAHGKYWGHEFEKVGQC
jgi:hypothetical protein